MSANTCRESKAVLLVKPSISKKLPAQTSDKKRCYKGRSPKFKGAVVDTGAAKSCIGIRQAVAYSHLQGKRLLIEPSQISFKFGVVVCKSQVVVLINLPKQKEQR